jgi:hypothetical protein
LEPVCEEVKGDDDHVSALIDTVLKGPLPAADVKDGGRLAASREKHTNSLSDRISCPSGAVNTEEGMRCLLSRGLAATVLRGHYIKRMLMSPLADLAYKSLTHPAQARTKEALQ